MLSITTLIPDLNLGVVILAKTSNGGGALFTAVSRTITDSYFGLDDKQWINRYARIIKARSGTADKVTEKRGKQ